MASFGLFAFTWPTAASGAEAATLDRAIAVGSDDGEERFDGSGVQLVGGTLELGGDHIGLRFTNITIPSGSVVASAWLAVTGKAPGGAAPALTLVAESADDSAPIAPVAGALTTRPRTGSSVAWTPPVIVADAEQVSPSVVGLVQEVVDRAGWRSGNAITFIILGQGLASTPGVYSYESSQSAGGGRAAKLYIETTNARSFFACGCESSGAPGLALFAALAAMWAANVFSRSRRGRKSGRAGPGREVAPP